VKIRGVKPTTRLHPAQTLPMSAAVPVFFPMHSWHPWALHLFFKVWKEIFSKAGRWRFETIISFKSLGKCMVSKHYIMVLLQHIETFILFLKSIHLRF
jgi:hypothetical protein